MRQSAVGQKCPRCARLPRRARAYGRPQHYAKAIAAGFGAALIGGLVYVQLLGAVGFGTLILAGLLGYGVGRAVRWGAAGQTLSPWPAVAATCAVVGMVLAFVVTRGRLPLSGFLLLAYAVSGYFAVRGLQS